MRDKTQTWRTWRRRGGGGGDLEAEWRGREPLRGGPELTAPGSNPRSASSFAFFICSRLPPLSKDAEDERTVNMLEVRTLSQVIVKIARSEHHPN